MKEERKSQVDEIFETEAGKCIECGNCLYSCPVYQESFDERFVARGRNHLIRELGLYGNSLSGFQEKGIFDKCLLCGRCVSACPRGVRNDLVVLAARSELIRLNGLSLGKSIAFGTLMADKEAMKRAVRFASRFQWMLPLTKREKRKDFEKVIRESSKVRHIPNFFLGAAAGRQIPSIARDFLSDTVVERNPGVPREESPKLRVAYFSGCATEFVLPHVGRSLISLLNSAGVEVIFPKNQGCCGIAMQANGDIQTAKAAALNNFEIFSALDVDMVVTGCATCGSTLKEGWSNLFTGDPRQQDFQEFAEKVRDISELLIDLADTGRMQFCSVLPPGTRVTYHDPCHLSRYQGITEQPRRILRQAFEKDFIEMDERGCCGCGGSFSLHSYELSRRIGKEKIDSIERTGADLVVNTCPGCMIQLVDGIERRRLPQKVLHLVEVVKPMKENRGGGR
ncbi:MAG: (Fe-S)-binding protein [Syntrophobacteraceae bacterium]|nr:(Fe-S)-binding protein [Syntrophobacteraceae bacterium]